MRELMSLTVNVRHMTSMCECVCVCVHALVQGVSAPPSSLLVAPPAPSWFLH